jgi:hypothetical protein
MLEDKFTVVHFNSSIASGINNHYKTPKTLGPDRLAAVIGANYLYPHTSNIDHRRGHIPSLMIMLMPGQIILAAAYRRV